MQTKIPTFLVGILVAIPLALNAALAADPLAELFSNSSEPNHAAATTSVKQDKENLADVTNAKTEAGAGAVTLAWDEVVGADSYTIYYGTKSVAADGGDYETSVLVGKVTTYEIKDLQAGQQYYFAVAAEDSTKAKVGSKNYSKEASATPAAAPVATVEPAEATVEEAKPAAPEDLPKSGPETALLVFAASAGAYFWRKTKRLF